MIVFRIADLFCGAGGTSSGAIEAVEHFGRKACLTAVNHWQVAIDTHEVNHPGSRHLCTGIDDINPNNLFGEGELDLLWASPECTHHSVARGGKPINDQSRATAWCVVRWAEKLLPPYILVENVPEFESWGPVDSKGRPIKKKKGEIFRAWLNTLRSLGYKVDHRLLCAADFGDPTTRTRLFVQAVRGRRRIVWPHATHSKNPDLLTQRRWTAAREIIDWDLPSTSIYERKKALSPKTMARIEAGLRKFGLKNFILPQHSNPTAKGVDEPVPTIVAEGSGPKLVQPFIIPQFGSNGPRSIDEPAPTVTTTSRGVGLAQPFIVPQFGEREGQQPRTHSIDAPLPAVTSHGAGALLEPFIVAWDHQSGTGTWSWDDPLSTVTTKARHGVAEPFLVELRGTAPAQVEGSSRSLDDPCSAVTTSGAHHALVEPFLIKTANGISRAGEATRAKSLEAPAPTLTTSGDLALIEPFLIQVAHGASPSGEANRAKSLDGPLPTVCGNRGDMALIEPFIMSAGGPECGARSVSLPVGTVLTRDHRALVVPALLPQQSDGRLRSVEEPAPTVATSGAIALVEPFLVSFYGNGQAHSMGEPVPTVTCKDRFALARPVVEIDGNRYLLDIRFRMLQPHELAAAQGFPKGYRFTGTKTDAVKQIGNAVPRRLARALVAAVVSQNPDVSALVDAEERSGEEEAA